MAALDPCPERLPEILLEKCAAISVNPTAIDDLVNSMQCKSPGTSLSQPRNYVLLGSIN